MPKHVCQSCGGKVTFLEDVAGQRRACPHCEEVVTWGATEGAPPRPAPKPPPLPAAAVAESVSESDEQPEDRPKPRKQPRWQDVPPSLLGPYYALAAFTAALCFAPCLGILVLPLAIGTFAFGLYLNTHFRTYGWFAVCQSVMVIAGILGASFFARLNRAIEQEQRELEFQQRQLRRW